MTDIETIKQSISIVELAEKYNAQTKGKGAKITTRHNPLRSERTSSLILYPATNSFSDFGTQEGGSIIDFVMKAENIGTAEAIKRIKEMAGIEDAPAHPKPLQKHTKEDDDYITPEAINKIWGHTLKIDFSLEKHNDELANIAPLHLYHEAKEEDKKAFFDIVKWDRGQQTAFVLLKDEMGESRSLRYRRYEFRDEMNVPTGNVVKWCAYKGTQSSFPYIRIKNNDIILIVEGTHDYITAILAGYNVIALPSANYKLNERHVKDKICLFIDDDDGKEFMRPLYESLECSKMWFDHKIFKEAHGIKKAKDFSDYLYCFETLKEFKIAMEQYISSQKIDSHGWESAIDKITKPVTHEVIQAAENVNWMIDNAIIKKNITTIVGAPNVGKSAFAFSAVNELFKSDKIDTLLYFDADNPISYVKDRILRLIDSHGESKVRYYNGLNSSAKEMNEVLDILSNTRTGGDRTVIVIDSLKFFVNGSMNEDKLVSPFFDMLKSIRDKFGATIICLHHTRKSKDDEGKLTYNGSQVVEASTDNMVMLTKEYIYHKKSRSDRAGLKFNIDIDFENMSFELSEPEEENEEKNESDDKNQHYADIIYNYLIEKNAGVLQGAIVEDLKGDIPIRKTKEILWLEDYKNKYWSFTKGGGKSWIFTAIKKHNPSGTVTEYVYDDDIDIESMGLF